MHEKVASIVPVAHFHEVARDKYHMALSHLMEDKLYAGFFRRQSKLGAFVLLDNSVVETGQPEAPETYLEKARSIGASQVIATDYPLGAVQENLEALARFLTLTRIEKYQGKVLAVPHGATFQEWQECAVKMAKQGIDTIGISRLDLDRGIYSTRGQAYRWLKHKLTGTRINVHFLGCTHAPPGDLGSVLRESQAQGIDSSIAALFTKYGHTLAPDAIRPSDWEPIDILNDKYDETLLRTNLRIWRQLAIAFDEP